MSAVAACVLAAAITCVTSCHPETKVQSQRVSDASHEEAQSRLDVSRPVRTAVIGGMIMTGLWEEISRLYYEETGQKVVVMIAGQRPQLADALREGNVDLLTMHSGDITSNLVAEGYGIRMRPWTQNDLVIMGPASDPASIRGLTSGKDAFRRIANTQSNWIDTHSMGPREVAHALWRAARVTPVGDWVLKDEATNHKAILAFARAHQAYVVTGRMPVVFGKIPSEGMDILVQNDPAMRRPYMVMEANPKRFPQANSPGARHLSDFLFSDRVQDYLATAPSNQQDGVPFFHPVWRQEN